MKNFKAFELEESNMSSLTGGRDVAGTTATNCGTGYTQETKNDKDSNANCESKKEADAILGA